MFTLLCRLFTGVFVVSAYCSWRELLVKFYFVRYWCEDKSGKINKAFVFRVHYSPKFLIYFAVVFPFLSSPSLLPIGILSVVPIFENVSLSDECWMRRAGMEREKISLFSNIGLKEAAGVVWMLICLSSSNKPHPWERHQQLISRENFACSVESYTSFFFISVWKSWNVHTYTHVHEYVHRCVVGWLYNVACLYCFLKMYSSVYFCFKCEMFQWLNMELRRCFV